MANLSYINTEKSITDGRLSINRSGLNKVEHITDTIAWSTLCVAMVFYPTFAYFHVNLNNSNDRALAFVLFPLIILFGLFGLFRKLIEKKLIVIETSSPRHTNKKHLLEFLKLNGYEVFGESKEVIIVSFEENLSYDNRWTKTITFIIDDGRIYFTMVKNYPKVNPPVFFSHWSLKADLKKYFRDK
ncbi:hypothetical protein [Limnovirga soli]|uniref:Uncharacterized protein n=1 Tax=Limnovirga soli TaxID=2656915 RepID=A0A8J8JSQ8_9BACT|nr:hypothetical protein [Limnovirga soli]NNV57257.1 hypothetical protein [Limnovirga soli]